MARILILDDMPARHEVLARRYADAERVHVYTFEEAVSALVTGRFDLMLLDHDLGEERTGYHVALEIAALGPERLPVEAIVHSHNPAGAERMRDVLVAAGVRARLEPFSSGLATPRASPSSVPPPTVQERMNALLDACRALPEGLSLESLVANLRAAGASRIDAMYVLHRLRGMALAEAKSAVEASETWSDGREPDVASLEALMAFAKAMGDTVRKPK